jgi:hypothetical protein
VSTQQPSEEEMRAALEEQMRRITVQDVLIQTVVTLINLGGRRLGLAGPPEQAGEVDLEQARLAIEGARALLPLLPQDADLGPVRDALSQLQMAYAQLASGAKDETTSNQGESEAAPPAPAQQAQPGPSPADDAERAKARSKIWTPPGA